MKPAIEYHRLATRRQFFSGAGLSVGGLALGQLDGPTQSAATGMPRHRAISFIRRLPGLPHFAPRAKRLIYLHMNGAPSQLDLFDHKPGLQELFRQGASRLGPQRPADHHHDQRPGAVSRSRRACSSSSRAVKAAC